MQRIKASIRRLDTGYLVVLMIGLIAVWPFLSRASLPQETDAELHVFRLFELSTLVRQGELYPRWAPDFYHGYGYPIFNYYAPLTYYLGLAFELLPGLDAVDGVKIVFILGMLLGMIGVYGLVRDYWGRTAGYVSAGLFIYSPYIQFIDPHVRGVLPESFSFGVFPLALWGVDRLWHRGGRWSWAATVALTAMVVLSHNLMALLLTGLLLAWAVWQSVIQGAGERHQNDPGQKRMATLQMLSALLLGIGAAAFFWLPVMLERDAVNLQTLVGVGDNYDFHTHFLTWRELLSFSQRLDWSASEPAFRFNLGVIQWLGAGASLVMLVARRLTHGRVALFFALVSGVLLLLMLPVSTIVWEGVPFLPYFQFPWRMLGPAAVMLAILSGAGTQAFLDGVTRRMARGGGRDRAVMIPTAMAILLVLLPISAGLPLSQLAPWPDFGEVNLLRMSLIEHQGRWLGTTSTADFVPTTVDMIPGRNSAVVQGFFEGLPLDRVNRAEGVIPKGTSVESEVLGPLNTRYHVVGDVDFRLRLFLFDFPGWVVRIDGTPVETELGRPEGFVVIPVPAGKHQVDVAFESTPARTLAVALSLASLLIAVIVAYVIPFKRPVWGPDNAAGESAEQKLWDWPVLAALSGFILIFLLILRPSGWLHHESAPYQAALAQVQTHADFGGQIALIGFDLSGDEVSPGESVEVALYWQALAPLEINYQVFLHLLAPDGSLAAQSDKLNPGDYPTKRWSTEKYVRDVHELALPPDLPAGRYTLSAGLWVGSEGWRLGLLDGLGNQIGDSYPLIQLTVSE